MKNLFYLVFAAFLSFATVHAQQSPAAGEKTETKRGFKNVTPQEFDKLRQSKTNVVLDVRTKEEYAEGHIPGSVLLDFMSPDFEKELAKLDKNSTFLVHCASGGRSARACKKMEALGFKNLYNLQGGMGAWEKAGKEVKK